MIRFDDIGKIIFDSFSKSTEDYLFISDEENGMTRWSYNTVEDFDIPGEFVKNNYEVWSSLIHPNDLHIFEEDMQNVINKKQIMHHCEYRVRKRTGEYILIRCRGQVTRDSEGNIKWFIGIVEDISKNDRIDSLTNIFNIYEFHKKLGELINNTCINYGILMVGIDNFKKINTMYSYFVGNQVLLQAAKSLNRICPPNSCLYRIEGDKFAYICPAYTHDEITQLFDNVSEEMKHLKLSGNEEISLSVSGGALITKPERLFVGEVHKDLEHALFIAKTTARGTLTFFSEELLEKSLQDLRLREEISRCVQNNCRDFELYFQPIVNGSDGSLYSCEALLRWNNDKFPDVYPDKFIPILEETGQIRQVGKWVIHEGVRQLKEWQKVKPDLKMNINVSYVQLTEHGLREYIIEQLDSLNISHSTMVIEITESSDIQDINLVAKFVNDIRKDGIEIALDDFGTGYASISILQMITADWIKLDHNFVSQITVDRFNRNIVQYLVSLCHSLEYKVCVEGVEDEDCFLMVQEQEVESVQGYYFSRPVSADRFEKQYIKCNTL